jgi:hypothetical protein
LTTRRRLTAAGLTAAVAVTVMDATPAAAGPASIRLQGDAARAAEPDSMRVPYRAAVWHADPARVLPAAWPWQHILVYSLAGALAIAIAWAASWWWRRTRPAPWRRGPYIWVVFLLALLAVAVPVGAAVALLGARLTGNAGTDVPGTVDHGWTGQRRELTLGVPASDGAVEFTVYRVDCTGGGARACRAIVAVRNVSDRPQPWAAELQRLYISDTVWTSADPLAGATANGGMDVFRDPLVPGQRLLATLVFPLPTGAAPTRLELREGAFARGVYLRLP